MKKLLLVPLMLLPLKTLADCKCVCMNGEVRAICSSTLDIEPICPPRICPIVPPSIAPIRMPRIAPIGTTRCVQKQVYNEYTMRYEWKEVCY
jgi:hypothetical protein